VELLIEKSQLIHLDADLNYTVDTIKDNGLTKYYYFNRLLELDSTCVIKGDSVFLSKDVYWKSSNTKSIYSSQFSQNGNKTMETVVIRYKDNIVTKRVCSKSHVKFKSKIQEKWVNSKIEWMKWTFPMTKGYNEWKFERDSIGFERKIHVKMGPDLKKKSYTVLIQYLEWDSLGNWTKRIEYNESDLTGSVVTRQIKYGK